MNDEGTRTPTDGQKALLLEAILDELKGLSNSVRSIGKPPEPKTFNIKLPDGVTPAEARDALALRCRKIPL